MCTCVCVRMKVCTLQVVRVNKRSAAGGSRGVIIRAQRKDKLFFHSGLIHTTFCCLLPFPTTHHSIHMHTCMHAIAAPTTPYSTHGSNQGIIFSTSCFRARILITCIVIFFFCQFVHSQAVCMNELHSPNSINGPFIASLR